MPQGRSAIGAHRLGLVAGCASAPRTPPVDREAKARRPPMPTPRTAAARGGGYYLDDGPGDGPRRPTSTAFRMRSRASRR